MPLHAVHQDDVTAIAVVKRIGGVELRYPWPHYIGTFPSEEDKQRSSGTADHPFRTGEFMRRIRLSADMSLLEVGTVMATVCEYNSVSPARCALWPIARMLKQSRRDAEEGQTWVVAGGIELHADGEHVVGPECCCGLEKWREWQVFAAGGDAPWSGHSPDPHFEKLESGELQIGYQGEHLPAPVAISPEALRAALERAERDLQGFIEVLSKWADQVVPRQSRELVTAFAKMLDLRRAEGE